MAINDGWSHDTCSGSRRPQSPVKQAILPTRGLEWIQTTNSFAALDISNFPPLLWIERGFSICRRPALGATGSSYPASRPSKGSPTPVKSESGRISLSFSPAVILGSSMALCGCTVNIPTLDNRVIPLPCHDVIKPGTVKRLRGEGLPLPKSPTQRGDLIVEFTVRFPDRIPPQSREIIRQHLPQS